MRMYAVVSAMKLCGSLCVFFYNKLAMRKSSWSLKKKKKKNADWHSSVQVNGCDFGEDAAVCNGAEMAAAFFMKRL